VDNTHPYFENDRSTSTEETGRLMYDFANAVSLGSRVCLARQHKVTSFVFLEMPSQNLIKFEENIGKIFSKKAEFRGSAQIPLAAESIDPYQSAPSGRCL
jgi:hypothetical protein